jgi:hypothetical protein
MGTSSHTTEGLPSECPLCGKNVWTTPSQPPGDATCPHCGNLLWFQPGDLKIGDPIRRLAELGAEVEVDNEGQVTIVRFSGPTYNDSIVDRLIGLSSVSVIDIRDTAITDAGAKRLQRLLPNVTVHH